MDTTNFMALINRVLPILFLPLLGMVIRRRKILSMSTIEQLKKLIVTIALPAVLFPSFLSIELKTSYLYIFALVFGFCILLYAIGRGIGSLQKNRHPYLPFMTTGFEYGMLGIGLFGSIFGMEAIGVIGVISLGHEIFIWFVYLALLLKKSRGIGRPSEMLATFFRSPVILAILAGIGLNLLGLKEELPVWPITGALISTMGFLGNLTIPCILIIVGYGIRIEPKALKPVIPLSILRPFLTGSAAILIGRFFLRDFLGLSPLFEAALFTLLVLPPPFILPLYKGETTEEETGYINNTLMLHTLSSLVFFTLYVFIFGMQL